MSTNEYFKKKKGISDKIRMKSTNALWIKINRFVWLYSSNNLFIRLFVINCLALFLCKLNILEISNTVDFFRFSNHQQVLEILPECHFWLERYMYIHRWKQKFLESVMDRKKNRSPHYRERSPGWKTIFVQRSGKPSSGQKIEEQCTGLGGEGEKKAPFVETRERGTAHSHAIIVNDTRPPAALKLPKGSLIDVTIPPFRYEQNTTILCSLDNFFHAV